jgi:thioredoxin 1
MQELKSEEEFVSTLEKMGQTEGLVIVDFFAQWCAPCKTLLSTIENGVEEEVGAHFYKVDIDLIHKQCTELGVRTVPTLIAFGNGKIVGRRTGAGTKQDIIDWIGTL